ncbi:MAG: ATP-binding protein [Actinomycetia bacterium]|nr:ATP-binding protein [Actinomycetes bacterium]
MSANVLLAAIAGAISTAVVLWLVWGRRNRWETVTSPPQSMGSEPGDELPSGVIDVLAVLASTSIVVDDMDVVTAASPSAAAYGLVRRAGLVHADIKRLVHAVRDDGQIREDTLRLPRGPNPGLAADRLLMGVRAAPLGERHVLVLIQDKTYADRVEMVRRDFVANVSHELKTPVGGISLLAEAVMDAKDDPEAVERFASRMQVESARLARLVTDIVDLTRLQVADSLHEPIRVDLGSVVREAVDASLVIAEAKDIALDTVTEPGLYTFGDEDLLVTAVRNLVTNAVNYSGEGTRVAIGAHRRAETVEIVVADHGHGIPPEEQDRIFERFYRIDPARSRATGGTGLGLSIVKHVCATHGGSVSVWSQVGKGSTFTIRLPLGGEVLDDEAPGATSVRQTQGGLPDDHPRSPSAPQHQGVARA